MHLDQRKHAISSKKRIILSKKLAGFIQVGITKQESIGQGLNDICCKCILIYLWECREKLNLEFQVQNKTASVSHTKIIFDMINRNTFLRKPKVTLFWENLKWRSGLAPLTAIQTKDPRFETTFEIHIFEIFDSFQQQITTEGISISGTETFGFQFAFQAVLGKEMQRQSYERVVIVRKALPRVTLPLSESRKQ